MVDVVAVVDSAVPGKLSLSLTSSSLLVCPLLRKDTLDPLSFHVSYTVDFSVPGTVSNENAREKTASRPARRHDGLLQQGEARSSC